MRSFLNRPIAVASILVTFGLIQGCSSGDWSKTAVAQTKADGDRIATALGKFYGEHDEYPVNLNQLVPKYIEAIVPPKAGDRSWRYDTFEGRKRYTLAVDGYDSHEPTLYRGSGDDSWSLDDK